MVEFVYPKVYLYRRIVQAKLYMDQHYMEPIDLNNIADEALFSKFHFIRLFKKSYGKTPHQYLTAVRLEKAKLLLQTGASVIEVCFSIGFESISSFTGLFKTTLGVTPSAYRLQQTRILEEVQAVPLKFVPNCFAEAKGWTKKSNFQEAHI